MAIRLANPARVAAKAQCDVWLPPPPVDYVRWAADNIVFSERESPFPGPYNHELFPFFREIFRALGPGDPCRIVTLKGSAQIGKTVVANVFTLGTQDMEPCDFLYVHPTEENGRRWSRLKLKPMLAGTASLRRLFPEKSRDGGDAIMFKERVDGRGSIQISGANSPASLSQVSMPRQVQDDLSKWEMNAAGDPEGQADSRSRAYAFAKILKISTPLVAPGCRITTNFEAGTQEHFEVPCPHCGHLHALEWATMQANLAREHPDRVSFTCPACGGVIEEHHRAAMVRGGRWVARNPKARHHRSFYLWSAYAPLQSWELIASEWFKAEGKPEAERVFLNDAVGLAYHFKGEAPPWEGLRDRANEKGHARGRVPAGFVILTLGIDCQKDRVEAQLVAWGREGRRAVVDYFVIPGHISEPETRAALDKLLEQCWRNEAGRELGIDRAAIDGNAWTEDVWDWARRKPVSRVIMVRGDKGDSGPLLARVKRERDHKGKTIPWSRRFYNLGVSTLKMGLYRRLAKADPLAFGYVALPKGLEDEYFIQLTSERRVEEKNRDGYTVARWKKDPNLNNEVLDTMNQAEGAALNLGVRSMPESAWDRLEAERETPPASGQLDFEDLPLGGAARPAAADKPGGKSPSIARRLA